MDIRRMGENKEKEKKTSVQNITKEMKIKMT